MSIPNKHHFVPECYLKAFANSTKDFYSFFIRYKHIKYSSIGKECYEPNYFKITEEETFIFNEVKDPYEIENYSFKKQENEFSLLVNKFVEKNDKPFDVSKEKQNNS